MQARDLVAPLTSAKLSRVWVRSAKRYINEGVSRSLEYISALFCAMMLDLAALSSLDKLVHAAGGVTYYLAVRLPDGSISKFGNPHVATETSFQSRQDALGCLTPLTWRSSRTVGLSETSPNTTSSEWSSAFSTDFEGTLSDNTPPQWPELTMLATTATIATPCNLEEYDQIEEPVMPINVGRYDQPKETTRPYNVKRHYKIHEPTDICGLKTVRSVSVVKEESASAIMIGQLFSRLQQSMCAKLTRLWIKILMPRKRAVYPYSKGCKPSWWPDNARYIDSWHLLKSERLLVLQAVVLYRGVSLEVLERVAQSEFSQAELSPKIFSRIISVAKELRVAGHYTPEVPSHLLSKNVARQMPESTERTYFDEYSEHCLT